MKTEKRLIDANALKKMDDNRTILIRLLNEIFDWNFHPEALSSKEIKLLADRLLANGVMIQSWIPVTERLPEPLCDVLIYDATFKMPVMGYMTQHKEWVGVCMKNDITHWMPMPEPPKEV